MKNKTEEFIINVLTKFQENKGRASVYCFNDYIIPQLVCKIIENFNNKHQRESIFIVVDNYNTRVKLLDYFKNNINDYKDNYNIKILSLDYINTKYTYPYKLIITVGVNSDYFKIFHLYSKSKFMLSILTKNIMDNQFILNVRDILPNLNISNNENEIEKDRIYSPVEETQVPVTLSDEDLETLEKYNNFIANCVSIFGNFDNIEKCKNGDAFLNISSSEFRYQLAKENGWSETLDVSIDFIKQIDDTYNPNVLFEKACTFYNIVRQRQLLLSDNESKLEAIGNICKEHIGSRILIVSKRGEFASKVTEYLNKNINCVCGDYHDCIENKLLVDDFGNPVLYKSGENKGKPKFVGAQAISTNNENNYNRGLLNILSIKYSSNKKLNIECDFVIFTDVKSCDIFDFKTRFNKVNINRNPTKIYVIYCENTIEEKSLHNETTNKLIRIINDNKKNMQYDENSGSIIL